MGCALAMLAGGCEGPVGYAPPLEGPSPRDAGAPPAYVSPCAEGQRFQAVAAQYDVGCALTCDGDLWCWGSNKYGSLGQGTHGYETLLRRVVDLPPSVAMMVNYKTVCAIASGGELRCWGRGVLGDGSFGSDAPVLVPLPPVAQVDGLGDSVCAVTPSGELFWWGYSLFTTDPDGSMVPVPLSDLHPHLRLPRLRACAASDGAPAVLDQEGGLWGWGDGYFSGVGEDTLVPTRVLDSVASLGAVGNFRVAVHVDHTVSWWGAAPNGPTTPEKLTFADGSPVRRVVQADCGMFHCCAVASEEALCWGSVPPETGFEVHPTPSPLGAVRAVTAGRQATCAITTDERILCHGCGPLVEVVSPAVSCWEPELVEIPIP